MGKYIGQEISYGLFEKQELLNRDQVSPPLGPTITSYYLNRPVSSATAIQVVCERAILEPNVDYTVRTINGRSILALHNIDLDPGADGNLSLYVVFLGQTLLTPGAGDLPLEVANAIANKADLSYVDTRIDTLRPGIENVPNSFIDTLSPASGTLTINTSSGNCILGNLVASVTTWAFTNAPTANGKSFVVSVVISGDVAYTYGDACTVNGVPVSDGIKWSGGSAPTATSNTDMLSFVIIRDQSGVIRVFGSAITNFS